MNNEYMYFTSLKRITKYESIESIRRHAEKRYGLSYEEALEMAYENVLNEARYAIKGKRAPKLPSPKVSA